MAEKEPEEKPQDPKSEQVEEEFELTPEIMEYENRRTDIIISLAVVALALFLAAIRDRSADLWLRFRSGQLISETFPSIPKTDTLTYASEGKPWVNPNWLYDWATYQIAKPGFDETGAATANGTVLVAIKVALCVFTIVMLLAMRYPGPTRWWAAVCAGIAAIGLSGRINLSSEIVANFLLATLALLWFQARHRGRFGLLYLSIPLTVLWANIDMTFVLAPGLLLLAGVGEALQLALPDRGKFGRPLTGGQASQVFVVAILCGLAGVATPNGLNGLMFPYTWIQKILPIVPPLERGMMGWNPMPLATYFESLVQGSLPWSFHAWFALLALAIAGFVLNIASFSVTRLLWTLAGVGLPFVAQRYSPMSCVLLAIPASLNFQEFFLSYWGAHARITRGWVLWSQIGRALTVLLVFAGIFSAFTGRAQKLAGVFGFGIRTENYMIDAARYLEKLKPSGHALSFTMPLANFRSWAQPGAKDFVDTRFQVANKAMVEYSTIRNALLGDIYPRPPVAPKADASPKGTPAAKVDPAAKPVAAIPNAADAPVANEPPVPIQQPGPPAFVPPTPEELAAHEKIWKDAFDKYKITHIIIDPRLDSGGANLQRVLNNLLSSPNFVPLFLSDQAMVFGRIDESPSNVDRKLFQEKGLKANRLVFRERREPPKPTERFVQAPGWIDWIWRTREAITPGVVTGETYRRIVRNIEQPGGVYLSVQTIRDVLAENPDSGEAYLALELAYNGLFRYEAFTALLANRAEEARVKKAADAQKPTATPAKGTDAVGKSAVAKKDTNPNAQAQQQQELRLPATNDFIAMRHYQIMAAARAAAIAQPNNAFAQLELYKLCFSNRFYDSALFHLREARRILPKDDVQDQLQRIEIALEAEIKARRERYDQIVENIKTEREKRGEDPDHPYERASIALGQRLTQLAMDQIDGASAFSPDLANAGPFVVGLYLTMGFPDKALQPLQQMRTQQRQFAAGEWSWLWGQIQLLQGQYAEAVKSVDTALAELRAGKVMAMIEGFDRRARDGELLGVFGESSTMGNDVDREARYLFTAGLLRLEMGEPDQALKSFKKCLELYPRYGYRTVIGGYWPLLTDDKMPPIPEYDFEKSEIKARFPKPSATAKPADGKPAPAATKPAETKKAEIKPVPNSTKSP